MAQLTATQVRDGVAWVVNKPLESAEPSDNPWIWFWEAVQGDFNEDRSTAQIVTDAALSMVPGVDQICDIRDLIANCRKLKQDLGDGWAWLSLGLTLIGLIPSLGSLLKGVLKIFFLFIRRYGADALAKAVDDGLTWVIAYLRRPEVQEYLGQLQIDEVFGWLAVQVRALRAKVNVKTLLAAFDSGIATMAKLVEMVAPLPKIGAAAKAALAEVRHIRAMAEAPLRKQIDPLLRILQAISLRMERRMLFERRAILDVNQVHARGTLPEAASVTLMRDRRPAPKWLSTGTRPDDFRAADADNERLNVDEAVKDGYPKLDDYNIESFHALAKAEIKGPARLYRVVSPNSRALGDCWVSEEVFNQLKKAPDPRAAWRKYLAVWPHWNANGQFVVYDVKPGETLKVWRGPTASQAQSGLPDAYLEGGWEQIVFTLDRTSPLHDVIRYYKSAANGSGQLGGWIDQATYSALPKHMQKEYVSIREAINHPNISGPYETGWGYTDFDGASLPVRLGLPALKGQITTERTS